MGDSDRPSTSERNAVNEAAFKGLPLPGSPAYWARLEDAAKASRLDLEVLVMCARERLAAGALGDVERIYMLLLSKTEARLIGWAETLIPKGVRERARIIEDLMQECRLGLWRELDSPDRTFVTHGFWTRMWRMMTNLAAQIRIAEGLRPRAGVVKPTRVPLSQLDSLDQATGPEDARTPGDSIADPQAHEAYGLAETLSDLRAVAPQLTADERLLLWNDLTGTYTQAELGEILGITARAVRDRRTALHAKLKELLDPGNPDHPGGPGSPGDGGAIDGGEERDD